MATATTPSCCSSASSNDFSKLASLLKRAIDLIDPSSSASARPISSDDVDDSQGQSGGSVSVSHHHASLIDNNCQADKDGAALSKAKSSPAGNAPAAPPSNANGKTKKTVRFSKSCAPPKRIISASDAIKAYDLLLQAASISSLLVGTNGNVGGFVNNINWETLQLTADVYRALLVTCCLLMELLPSDLSAADTTTDVTEDSTHDHGNTNRDVQSLQSTTSKNSTTTKWPLPKSIDDFPHVIIPALTPQIEQTLLATCRRSILLLQHLERTCAAKSVSQRHSQTSCVQQQKSIINGSLVNNNSSLSFYTGGEDISDYDRPLSDLHRNYDWHDDGYLPLPLDYPNSHNDHGGIEEADDDDTINHTQSKQQLDNADSSKSNSIKEQNQLKQESNEQSRNEENCRMNNNESNNNKKPKTSNKQTNILFECCYRPQHPTDPPSSKHEKSAWTRDWISGERIVSLRLNDYRNSDSNDTDRCCWDPEGELKLAMHEEEAGEDDAVIAANVNDGAKNSNLPAQSDSGINDKVDESVIQNNNTTINSNIDNEENTIIILLDELEKEEDSLLDIMMPSNGVPANNSSSSSSKQAKKSHKQRRMNETAKRKRKRQNQRQRKNKAAEAAVQHSIETSADDDVTAATRYQDDPSDSSVHVKEGFLLLVSTKGHHDDVFDFHGKPIRVYARIQPSGLLSIEDCGIHHDRGRFSGSSHDDNNEVSEEPIMSRVRYYDFMIGSNAHCQPYMPKSAEGSSSLSFHFRLDGIHLLGASSLNNRQQHQSSTSSNDKENTTTVSIANLMFSVDESTGGAFMDGFEWVNALSGAASNAALLLESMCLEWGQEVE